MRQGAVAILIGLVAIPGVSPAAGTGAPAPGGSSVTAQPAPGGSPVPIHGHLAPTPALDGIDDLVVSELRRWGVPGVAVGALVDGRVTMARGYGWRDLERRLPVTPETVFPVGSVTKPVTATALASLVDDGLLEWDRPVVEQLPGFELADREATARTTLRDLLTHRTGLPRHDLFWYGAGLDRDELVRRLRFLPPSRPFRAAFQYQNLGYVVAGRLAGHVTGTSWESVVRERLLRPLGMRSTNLSVSELSRPPGSAPSSASSTPRPAADFALPYAGAGRRLRQVPFRNVDAVAPALGVNSSVDDLLGFLALHLDDGRPLLRPATVRELHQPQIEMSAPDDPEADGGGTTHYTLGLVASDDGGHRLLSHEGGVDGFRARLSLLPDDDVGIVVLANSSADHDLVARLDRELRHRLLGRVGRADRDARSGSGREATISASRPAGRRGDGRGDRAEATAGQHLLEIPGRAAPTGSWEAAGDLPAGAYTGNFEHPAYGVVGVWMRDGRLELLFHGLDLPLEPGREGGFAIVEGEPFAGLPVRFGADRTGDVDRLALPLEAAVAPIVFQRVPSSWTREPSFLHDFIGAYRLDGALLRVALDGDVLRLTIPGADTYDLVPLDQATFDVHGLDGTSLEFRRDGAGDVVGMAVRQTHATLVATLVTDGR